MPHIACGAEVYADSGLSPAGVAWKMTRLIDERTSNGKCGLHLGVNQCLVCCFIDGLLMVYWVVVIGWAVWKERT